MHAKIIRERERERERERVEVRERRGREGEREGGDERRDGEKKRNSLTQVYFHIINYKTYRGSNYAKYPSSAIQILNQ